MSSSTLRATTGGGPPSTSHTVSTWWDEAPPRSARSVAGDEGLGGERVLHAVGEQQVARAGALELRLRSGPEGRAGVGAEDAVGPPRLQASAPVVRRRCSRASRSCTPRGRAGYDGTFHAATTSATTPKRHRAGKRRWAAEEGSSRARWGADEAVGPVAAEALDERVIDAGTTTIVASQQQSIPAAPMSPELAEPARSP